MAKGLRKARKKFAASHILLIKRDRARAVITRFGEAKLKAYTISLSLTDIAAQTDVWQGEVENTQIVDHGKNDKARLKSLVEQHFVKAGIISTKGVWSRRCIREITLATLREINCILFEINRFYQSSVAVKQGFHKQYLLLGFSLFTARSLFKAHYNGSVSGKAQFDWLISG